MGILHVITRRIAPLFPSDVIEGYEHPDLIETIFRKTVAFVPSSSWPAIRGARAVLDFGGGCGHHYKVAANEVPDARWAIVETPAMASRASEIETDRLRFFSSIDTAAAWLGPIDVVHSNGAPQYTADPLAVISALFALGAARMLWSRIWFSESPAIEQQTSWLVDNGPPVFQFSTRKVRVARRSITRTAFFAAHAASYFLTSERKDAFEFRSTASP